VSVPEPPNAAERRRWNDPEWVRRWLARERLTDFTTGALLTHLAPEPGERVLEVGCGTGRLSAVLAGRLGDGGSVVGVDLSEPLVGLARERAAAADLANATFVVGDAQVDGVPGGPFDAATSQFGVMFFEDPRAAFANLATHVAEDGRLAFVTWQRVEENPWYVLGELAPFLPPERRMDPDAPTGPFSMADPPAVLELLRDSGWRDAACTPYREIVTVERFLLIGSEEGGIAGVAPQDQPRALAAIEATLQPFRSGDTTYEVPIAFLVFTASRS
jgi:SAM-dependent methyltransferase